MYLLYVSPGPWSDCSGLCSLAATSEPRGSEPTSLSRSLARQMKIGKSLTDFFMHSCMFRYIRIKFHSQFISSICASAVTVYPYYLLKECQWLRSRDVPYNYKLGVEFLRAPPKIHLEPLDYVLCQSFTQQIYICTLFMSSYVLSIQNKSQKYRINVNSSRFKNR